MERGEERAQMTYHRIADAIPEARRIAEDAGAHEPELIGMIDEERLRYVGSVVLGLNDDSARHRASHNSANRPPSVL